MSSAAATTTTTSATTTAAATTAHRTRVRQILSNLSTTETASLKKLLPKGVVTDKAISALGPSKYPSALLNALPADQNYCLMGHIAEAMLREPADDITLETLFEKVREHYPEFSAAAQAKVTKSVTTQPFLTVLRETRTDLEAIFEGPVAFEPTFSSVAAPHVEGHPDMVSEGHIFEIKLAGQPKKDWTSFLLQVFSYAALESAATNVHLVLPLHKHVWSFDLEDWPTVSRKAYLAFLEAAATKAQTTGADAAVQRQALFDRCAIGLHVEKKGGFAKSVAPLDPAKPWQLFLSSNRSTRVAVKQEEIDAGAALIAETGHRIFVHAPYLINLAADPATDEYNVKCLTDTLEAAAAIGCRGVVVHVGKYTTQDPEVAIENMEANLRAAMESATADCPILLETPAGQGTELLTTHDEFMAFIDRFDNDVRLRVCIDTCHVWAAGEDPLAYIKKVVLFHEDMLKLIHFNDSEGASSCCVDRHAPPGSGAIGFEQMTAIAEFGAEHGVPMLFE